MEDRLSESTQGLSGGTGGVLYWESAARERSQRLGAHTPTRTRHAAMTRLKLEDRVRVRQWLMLPWMKKNVMDV